MDSARYWPVRLADERMLEVFDNDSIRRILHVKRRDCVPSVELRRRLYLTSIPALFVQRRLRWFGDATTDKEPSSSSTASHVGQVNWRPAEEVGYHDQGRPAAPLRKARWRKDWVNISSELTQDCRAWGASIKSISDADTSTSK